MGLFTPCVFFTNPESWIFGWFGWFNWVPKEQFHSERVFSWSPFQFSGTKWYLAIPPKKDFTKTHLPVYLCLASGKKSSLPKITPSRNHKKSLPHFLMDFFFAEGSTPSCCNCCNISAVTSQWRPCKLGVSRERQRLTPKTMSPEGGGAMRAPVWSDIEGMNWIVVEAPRIFFGGPTSPKRASKRLFVIFAGQIRSLLKILLLFKYTHISYL